MKKMNKGDKLVIHCYKHNGVLYETSEEAIVLEDNDEFLVVGNKNALVAKNDGRKWHTKEPAIIFFYKEKWFNIIAQFKKIGLFYYCNVASPYIIEDNTIKYIDYDLDLRVFPDGGFKVLDRNEYNYHKRIMHYSKEIDMVVKYSLTELINLKKNEKDPFNQESISKYYDMYKEFDSTL